MGRRETKRGSQLVCVLLALMLAGCAGMMMDVKDASKTNAGVRLEKGATVMLAPPDVSVVKDELGDKEAARVLKLIQKGFQQQLKEHGLKFAKDSENSISVKVTEFTDGCGFCRGFFPFFGLGDSYLNARVQLRTTTGASRTLIVEKTGQASGVGMMGDQTETNAEYLAEVSLDAFLESKEKEEEEEED